MFQRENIIKRRPLAATYLCRKAAKARFDNRPQLEGVSKEGGPQPSLFGRFKGKGFLRKGGNPNPPFLKPFFGHFLSGKKVTRRRQKRAESQRAGQSPAPTHRLPITCAYTLPGGQGRPPLQPSTYRVAVLFPQNANYFLLRREKTVNFLTCRGEGDKINKVEAKTERKGRAVWQDRLITQQNTTAS